VDDPERCSADARSPWSGLSMIWSSQLPARHKRSGRRRQANTSEIDLRTSAASDLLIRIGWLRGNVPLVLGLLWDRFLKSTLILLFLQLLGTFLPLLFFPSEKWKHFPYAPTLKGQHIIKNLVLVCAAIIVGSTVRGERLFRTPMQRASGRKRKSSTADSVDAFTENPE